MFSQYENPSNPVPPGMPKNWLVESILVTLCYCLPFGIVAIIQASNVEQRYRFGDYDGAVMAAEQAKKWVTIGFITGIVINGGVMLLYLFLLFMGIDQGYQY